MILQELKKDVLLLFFFALVKVQATSRWDHGVSREISEWTLCLTKFEQDSNYRDVHNVADHDLFVDHL